MGVVFLPLVFFQIVCVCARASERMCVHVHMGVYMDEHGMVSAQLEIVLSSPRLVLETKHRWLFYLLHHLSSPAALTVNCLIYDHWIIF